MTYSFGTQITYPTSLDSYQLAKSPLKLLATSNLRDSVERQTRALCVGRSLNHCRHVAVHEGQHGARPSKALIVRDGEIPLFSSASSPRFRTLHGRCTPAYDVGHASSHRNEPLVARARLSYTSKYLFKETLTTEQGKSRHPLRNHDLLLANRPASTLIPQPLSPSLYFLTYPSPPQGRYFATCITRLYRDRGRSVSLSNSAAGKYYLSISAYGAYPDPGDKDT